MGERLIGVHDVVRYPRGGDQSSIEVDGYPNYHFLTSPAELGLAKLMLESGINPVAQVRHHDLVRRPAISIRSSPWKAGHESNPWHDEFDLDHGHVRYYGDHKVDTVGLPGATAGNRALLDAWLLHNATTKAERLLAPPLIMWRAKTVYRQGRALHKGYVEFCGIGLIERLEYVVQRDGTTGRSFPNIVLDIAVVAADSGEVFDMRWIDDRRDPSLALAQFYQRPRRGPRVPRLEQLTNPSWPVSDLFQRRAAPCDPTSLATSSRLILDLSRAAGNGARSSHLRRRPLGPPGRLRRASC